MSEAKTRLDACISECLKREVEDRDIARRLFLHDLPDVFRGSPHEGFSLFNEISIKFDVPFSCIKATGSAQVGYSYFSQRDFVAGDSDLDAAIISPHLFQRYSEVCYGLTDRYRDRTRFRGSGQLAGEEQYVAFLDYLAKGYFRPDLMPDCSYKTSWRDFFNRLTDRYFKIFKFKTITAGIYFSEYFFEHKQATLMQEYRKAHP